MKISVFPPRNLGAYLIQGMSYEQYRADFEKFALAVKSGQPVDMVHAEVLPLNWQRSIRVEKTFKLDEHLRNSLEKLDTRLSWIVITEPWCGDSAQSLPAIARIVEAAHGMIEFRILLRDRHHELIDLFLTEGKRGIPKLLQLDADGNVTAVWGPRPAEASALIARLKEDPDFTETYKEELHKWYAHDHCQSIQKEIIQVLPG